MTHEKCEARILYLVLMRNVTCDDSLVASEITICNDSLCVYLVINDWGEFST